MRNQIWIKNKPPLGVMINRSQSLSNGIVGAWLFNEGSGNKINDLSGNKNTGTLTNFTFPCPTTLGWNPGIFGKSLLYNGSTNAYIDCGNAASLNLGNVGAISLWLLHKTHTNSYPFILSKEDSTAHRNGYAIGMTGDYLYCGLCSASANLLVMSASSLVNNKIYHVLFTWNSKYVYLYSNSVLANVPVSQGSLVPISNVYNLQIGWHSTYSPGIYHGIIDNVIIWNRYLSPKEVLILYTNPFKIYER